MLGVLKELWYYGFEKPTHPLTRMQAFGLRGLYVEGLDMQPDKLSLQRGTDPTCMYAFLDGRHIGTAYGHRFVESREADDVPRSSEVIDAIRSCYLPPAQTRKEEDDAEDELRDATHL
ncbi:hypothetical protein KY359_01295 [Candidatus Woesearchaeota archaeon]|nr:hypothetical protein [Candidatus Woesearchaeota archaeon]